MIARGLRWLFRGFHGSVIESAMIFLLPGLFSASRILTIYICLMLVLWTLWTASERWQNVFRSSCKSSADAGSFEAIMIGIYVTQIASAIDYYYLQLVQPSLRFLTVGLSLWLSGALLRKLAIWTLGSRFTAVIQTMPGHDLVVNGIYKQLRHPGYAGELSSFLGTCFILASPVGGACWFLLLFVYGYRIQREEQLLLDEFGDRYREYMIHSNRLIPFVY